MRIARPLSLISALLCLWLLPERAFALVEFCNNFDHNVFFSIAYEQHSAKDQGSWYIARGWLEVDPTYCRYFDTALVVPTLYFRAETDYYKSGTRKSTQTFWPAKGDRSFWVQNDTFQFYDAEDGKQRPAKSARYVEFGASFTADDGDLSETVTINADGTMSQSIDATQQPSKNSPPAADTTPAQQTPPPIKPVQPTVSLDDAGKAIVARFRNAPDDRNWLDMVDARIVDKVIDEPAGPAQSRTTYKLHNAASDITTDLSLLVFPDESAAKKFVGTADGDGSYADDQPQGLSTFGHINHDQLPSGSALYKYVVDAKAKRLWLRCATQVGRSVLLTTTSEPSGNAKPEDTNLPNDKMAEGFFPLLMGVDALTRTPTQSPQTDYIHPDEEPQPAPSTRGGSGPSAGPGGH